MAGDLHVTAVKSFDSAILTLTKQRQKMED